MSQRTTKKPSKRTTDEDPSGSLFYPFLHNGYSKGVLISLLPALVACVVARAPQYHLENLFGQDLPISLDAINLILVAPLYFLVMTWLLLRLAHRSTKSNEIWNVNDTGVLRGLVILLGITAVFLLAQYFLVLAPDGACNQRPHLEILWTPDFLDHRAYHCMRNAAEINKTGWFYITPIILHTWLSILLVGVSLRFLCRSWKIWVNLPD